VIGRILEAVVILLVVRAIWKVLGGLFVVSTGASRTSTRGEPLAVKLIQDPVCGTYVSPSSSIADGREHFCSEKCRAEYRSQSRTAADSSKFKV
jgi:YHS domain-containing protein